MLNLFLQLLHLRGRTLGIDAELGGRLIDEVHCLVGEESVRDIPLAQLGSSDQGSIGDLDLVVRLIAGTEATQHLNGILNRRLADKDRLKPPLQGGVLLDVLPVLVQGSGPDTLKLTTSEGRLEHIAGIDSSLSSSSADHGMHLVDKEDDFPLCFPDFIHHRFQAFLKFAAELAPRHQRPHIEGDHPLLPEGIRNVISHDLLRQTLRNSGLPYPSFTNDYRIILGAPGQDLYHPLNLVLSPDYRIKLAFSGEHSQVATIFFQSAVLALRPGVGNPVSTPDLLKGTVYLLLIDAKVAEDTGSIPIAVAGDSDQEVLGADELIFQPVRLCSGVL